MDAHTMVTAAGILHPCAWSTSAGCSSVGLPPTTLPTLIGASVRLQNGDHEAELGWGQPHGQVPLADPSGLLPTGTRPLRVILGGRLSIFFHNGGYVSWPVRGITVESAAPATPADLISLGLAPDWLAACEDTRARLACHPRVETLGTLDRSLIRWYPTVAAFTVGRRAGNDWVLDDRFMSRHHATIEPREGGVFVDASPSTSGITVGGEPRVRSFIPFGASFRLGQTHVVLVRPGPA